MWVSLTFFYACYVVAGNKQRKRDEEEVSGYLLLKILNLGGGFHWDRIKYFIACY